MNLRESHQLRIIREFLATGRTQRALDALDQMLAEAVAPPPPPPTKPVWMRAGA